MDEYPILLRSTLLVSSIELSKVRKVMEIVNGYTESRPIRIIITSGRSVFVVDGKDHEKQL